MLPPLVIAAAVAVAAGGSFAALAKRAFPGGTAAVPREITVSRTAPVLPAGTPVHLLAVSDLHYISPKLNDGGEFFRRTVENADGKLTERSEEFLAALEAQTLKERPDALVISGDLTFNGEHQSLRDLKETFGRIREKGVTVLVLPGNHDVSYPMAVNFTGKGTERVKNVSLRNAVNSAMGRRRRRTGPPSVITIRCRKISRSCFSTQTLRRLPEPCCRRPWTSRSGS